MSNTNATLYVNVQLTVLVPVPDLALEDDTYIADATAHIQDIVYNAFNDYSTALTVVNADTLKIGDDVYDL
jgi:hypothetical protein